MEQDYSYYFTQMADSFRETEWTRSMYVVFNGLNGRLVEDGNKWCAITGTMPENYLAGFADTPALAMGSWYNEYLSNRIPSNQK